MKSKKWLISLGLAVVLVVAFALPACDGGGNGEPASRLNIATTALPDSLDMNQLELSNTNLGALYLMIVYEPLYRYPKIDKDLGDAYDFAPGLVTGKSWSNEGDNQILTLDLREGVKWNDGENFTADDVVFSFKSKVISPWAADMPVNWTAVDNYGDDDWCDDDICPEDILVEQGEDEYQVKMTYVKDYHQPEDYLPSDFLWYGIVPEHVFGLAGNGTYDDWNEDTGLWDGEYIATGPFKVKEFKVDEYLLLERNDDYWGDLPAAKEVLFSLYVDETAMWMAFERGDMDVVIGGVQFPKKDAYEADPDIQVDVLTDLSISALGFNLHPTGGNPLLVGEEGLPLRRAIAAAINKTDMCNIVAGGYAEPADSWVYVESPSHYGGANNYGILPNNTYNLTKAEEILTAANYTKESDGYWYTPAPDPEKITFKISSAPGHAEEAQKIVQDLQRGTTENPGLGLDVSFQVVDPTTFYGTYLYYPQDGFMDAFVWADDPAPDPWSDWIWCYFADPEEAGLEWNPCWYDVEEFDDLYWENYLATDLTRKGEILDEMQLMIAEDVPIVLLMRQEIITACRTDRWENWFNEMGGYVTWINDYSIREVTPVPVD
jgi:ABC-type transport system substrate-binding protein